jgi:hypothetical protein
MLSHVLVKLSRIVIGVVALGTVAACGGNPLKVGDGGSAGSGGSGGGSGGVGGGAGCASNQSAQYCSCAGVTTFIGCVDVGAQPACPAACDVLPPCSGLDAASCNARPDCFARQCPSCYGHTSVACFAVGVTPPVCIAPPCAVISICEQQDDEASCKATAGCKALQCPDCKGGQVYSGCVGPGDRGDCGPCPPACGGLDEAACNARGDCQAGYCNWCQQRTFVGCGDPGTAFACPSGGPACAPLPCAKVTDQLSCDARTDCHSVFGNWQSCGNPTAAGCPITFASCADGGKASCKVPPPSSFGFCAVAPPPCEASGYALAYVPTCFEGCVRPTECGP